MSAVLGPVDAGWAAADTPDDIVAALVASEQMVATLRAALVTERVIGIATGILMSQRAIAAEEAFDVLQTSSQTSGVEITEIADYVLRVGTTPASGRPRLTVVPK